MDSAQLRLCLFDVLKNLDTNRIRRFDLLLVQETARNAALRGFIAPQERGKEKLPYFDEERIRELFWSLIIQGVVVPGTSTDDSNLPLFTLTDYGRRVVSSPDPVPHDPDRYMEHIQNMAPTLDPAALSYIREGLECFQHGTYTASVVMLGIAAEKLTLDLADTVRQNLNSADESKRLLHAVENYGIARVFEEMGKRLRPRIHNLPKALADGLEGHLDGVFAIIRTHRNLASHPTGQKFDRLTAFGLFSSFPFYCKRTCDLIEHIRTNGFPASS